MAIWSVLGNTIDAFFIISAFVLFLPAVRRDGDLGGAVRFWIGRAARLLPAFWLVIALVLIVVAVVPPAADYAYPSFEEIVGHLTVMQMPLYFFDSGFRLGFGVDGPLWLVSVVVGFYLVLPLIARAYYRHPLLGLGLAAALTVGWKELIGRAPELLMPFVNWDEGLIALVGVDQLPGWAFSFGLGMTGAWAFVRARERWSAAQLSRAAIIGLPIALLAFGVVAYLRGRYALTVQGNVAQTARTHPVLTLADSATRAALMGVIVIGPLWMSRPFVNRPTARLAELSYGVYLVHFVLIFYAAEKLGLPRDGTLVDFVIWAAVILPPSLLFAYASRRFVELPVLHRVKAWQGGRRPQTTTGSQEGAEPSPPAGGELGHQARSPST